MRTLLILLLGLNVSFAYGKSCKMNFNLNSYAYNCEAKYGTYLFQFSSDCICHKTVKQFRNSAEGPIKFVTTKKCSKAIIRKNSSGNKYYNIFVKTFLKGVPMKDYLIFKSKYVNAKKNSCK